DLQIGGAGADLEQTLLSLVLGLVRQAGQSLSGPAGATVDAALNLLGLGGAAGIPSLPVDQLLQRGSAELRDWFVALLASDSARTAWLGALADLLGGTADGTTVTIPIGGGPVSAQLGFDVTTGASGHLLVTPTLALALTADVAGSLRIGAEAVARLLTID